MRLLADENIPFDTVRALRSAGHDVFAVVEAAAGASDDAHLTRGQAEQRLIVTFDRDFGEHAVHGVAKGVPGVILLRFVPTSAEQVSALLLELFGRADLTWAGYLSVIDLTHVRQRPL
jgi:predicted nuclease of predicted toxin-antitoxin system